MENREMARQMEEVADLLEIQGANPFRVRAWRNAAGTVDDLSRSVAEMVRDGEDLTRLPGVGTDIAASLEEMAREGRFSRLEEVALEIPRTLTQLVKLEGVGPRKARKLWEALGVKTVDELEAVVRAGKVERLEGFGKTSAARILRSIGDFRKHQGRFLLVDADELVRPLLDRLGEVAGVERVEVAGSWRRRQETVGDIDLLVLLEPGADPGPVLAAFTGFSGVERVEAAGEGRARVRLRSGLPVDLRVLPRSSYGAALHYFTGSKEHNVALRTLALRKGLRVSEYGVFRIPEGVDPDTLGPDEGERVGGATEEEVFAAVGLPWIPPELRRGRGELEAAREGRLPDLVTLEEIRGDLQMHTTWSDGADSIEAMARACLERGYGYMALTDHSGGQLAMVQGLTPERVLAQAREVEEVQARVPGIAILRSCEVDILRDGSLDLPDEVLGELDLVLVSVHAHLELDRKTMTDRVIRALENPHVHVLAHPTGRILNRREPHAMDVEEVLKAASALQVAVELNASPHRLDLSDLHVARARELGVPVVISTDAHAVQQLGWMHYGVEQARRAGLEAGDVLNTRPLKALRRWLGRRRGPGGGSQ
jgi:DNA polymerase (family X)